MFDLWLGREILKVLFNALGDAGGKPVDKAMCFCCLEELCNRQSLSQTLAAFTELFIVRVTDVQTAQMPREVTKAAENCGMSLALNFPPEVIARAICPIVNNRDVPVNQVRKHSLWHLFGTLGFFLQLCVVIFVFQMAIKMLQRLCDTCKLPKLRTLLPDIVTTLISAYDHPDSAVRKAAVFAIVALHSRYVQLTNFYNTFKFFYVELSKSWVFYGFRLGSEELSPHLAVLNGSKLKLLELYIQRAQQSASSS